MIATREDCAKIRASVGVGDRCEGELRAEGNVFQETWPQGASGQQGSEEGGRAEFGAWCYDGEGLGRNGGGEIKIETAQDVEVVAGGVGRPLEAEVDGVGESRGDTEDCAEQGGQATGREAREPFGGRKQARHGDELTLRGRRRGAGALDRGYGCGR